MTQTIILAAGSGSRLAAGSTGVPKPLVTVAGQSLMAHALAHARAAGCREAVIVLGYESARVRAAAESASNDLSLQFVENPDLSSPNGISLLTAAPLARSRFFLQMVDHVFAAPALPKLVAQPMTDDLAGRVLVDRNPVGLDLEDATRVRLTGDRVTAIGKHIEPWDAIDAGCFVLTPAIFDALRRVPSQSTTVSSGMRQLVERGLLGSADLEGVSWMDVDTPDDHAQAERLLVSAANLR